MELRSDGDGERPQRAARFVIWAVLAVALLTGVGLALLYGPQLTSLLDTLP